VADVLLDNTDEAAACSHRPTHVEHIFLDANSRHFMAWAILAMPEMQWLKQFLVETLNTDFLSAYQCELVGEVPEALLRWADIDDDWAEQ
jgi:hypothetical protein